jgi:hypothetical protein
LIVAGVVGGQALVEQAKSRSFIAKLQGYETAVHTFRLQYDAFPGDMANATSYWSGTSNGDGDKNMEGNSEKFYTWEQLYLSGIVPQIFIGGDAGTPDLQVGKNIPATPLGGGFLLRQVSYYTVNLGNVIEWGTCVGNCNQGLIDAKTSYNIDLKIDDGLIDSGRFRAVRSGSGCADQLWNNAGGANYVLNNSNKDCSGAYQL